MHISVILFSLFAIVWWTLARNVSVFTGLETLDVFVVVPKSNAKKMKMENEQIKLYIKYLVL